MESRATLDILPGFAFTPDGAAIVASYEGGFWWVPLDGSTPERIPFRADVRLRIGPQLDFDFPIDDAPTFVASQIRDAAASPDGTNVAFTVLGSLHVMPAGGGEPRRVGVDVPAPLYQPAWSPDGLRLAAVSWTEPEGGHLWSIPVGGGASTRLSSEPRFLREPVWSPAGDRVVVLDASVRTRLMGDTRADTDLVWYPAAGGAPARIELADGRAGPHFGPEGAERIYLSHGSRGLLSVRWDGTDEKEHLAPNGGRALARVENDLYVVTVPQLGEEPLVISIRNPSTAPFPVTKVTEYGASSLRGPPTSPRGRSSCAARDSSPCAATR
jgi:hypothetical protein